MRPTQIRLCVSTFSEARDDDDDDDDGGNDGDATSTSRRSSERKPKLSAGRDSNPCERRKCSSAF